MAQTILLNKPSGVLCSFTDPDGRPTLAKYVSVSGVYAAGRLDRDSEGLLLLTDDGGLQHRMSHPKFGKEKGYWVQVEGIPDEQALKQLRGGVWVKGRKTQKARVRVIQPPVLWERHPPVRFRKSVPTTWVELFIREGMNRQVRRMTAAVGFPTLRLVRFQIGPHKLGALQPGEWVRV